MKIVHLRASNFYGGPERQLHFHARFARDTEYEISIASFSTDGKTPDFLGPIMTDGIECRVYASRSAFDPGVLRSIRAHLHDDRIDLLCTHDYRSAILGGWAVRGTPARWIAFSRGFTSENLKILLYQELDKFVTRFADHVVAVSASQKRKLERVFVPSQKISVVPNAIDVEFFRHVGTTDLRARLGLGVETVIVIAGGRFSREKGQIHLVRAAALALEQAPDLRFVLYGHGPDLESVRAEIVALGLADRVFIPGFEREVLACIRGADILVNPSLSEGLPNIVLEAMALGVPVVATDVGGLPEIIEDGVTGRLVPPARPQALAQAIVDLALDRGGAERMANAARRFVETECTFARQFELLRAIYEAQGRP